MPNDTEVKLTLRWRGIVLIQQLAGGRTAWTELIARAPASELVPPKKVDSSAISQLSLTAQPSGSEIVLDGKLVGATPSTIELPGR